MPSQSPALQIRERRLSPRTVVPGPALIPVDIGEDTAGFILDLSAGGVSVHALSRLAPDSMHPLRWKFPGEDQAIEVTGKVIWTDRINLIGLQLTDLAAEDGSRLRQWLRECDRQSKSGAGSDSDPDETLFADLELGSLVRRAQALSHADGALVAIRFSDRWVCQASVGTAPEVGSRLSAEAVLCEQCIGMGQPIHCADSSRDPRLHCAGPSFGSAILVPIQRGEQGIGVIECLWAQPHPWDEPAVAMLSVVAELASVALPSYSFDNPESVPREQNREQVLGTPHSDDSGTATQEVDTVSLEAELETNHAEGLDSYLQARLAAATVGKFRRFNRIAAIVLLVTAALATGWYGGRNWNLVRPEHALPIASSIPAFHTPAVPALSSTGTVARRKTSATGVVPARATKANILASSDRAPSPNPIGRASLPTTGGGRQADLKTINIGPSKTTTAEDVVAPPTLEMLRAAGARSSVPEVAKKIATTTQVIAPSPPRISTVSPPVALNKVQPEYPAMALSMRRHGQVVLDVIVSKEGKVQDIHVVSGDPMLAAAAAKAMPLWHYKPAQLNGEAIEGQLRVTFNFTAPDAR